MNKKHKAKDTKKKEYDFYYDEDLEIHKLMQSPYSSLFNIIFKLFQLQLDYYILNEEHYHKTHISKFNKNKSKDIHEIFKSIDSSISNLTKKWKKGRNTKIIILLIPPITKLFREIRKNHDLGKPLSITEIENRFASITGPDNFFGYNWEIPKVPTLFRLTVKDELESEVKMAPNEYINNYIKSKKGPVEAAKAIAVKIIGKKAPNATKFRQHLKDSKKYTQNSVPCEYVVSTGIEDNKFRDEYLLYLFISQYENLIKQHPHKKDAKSERYQCYILRKIIKLSSSELSSELNSLLLKHEVVNREIQEYQKKHKEVLLSKLINS